MAKTTQEKASKAIQKLGTQKVRREAIGQTVDEIKAIRRPGYVVSLDGTVQ